MTADSPFSPVFSREVFLETLGAGEALRRLDDGLGAREPFLLVTGEAGIGKTVLANEALARWGSRVKAAFLAYPALAGAEFLEEIIRGFGAEPPDGVRRSKLLACLERALTETMDDGQVAMLTVDDAHCLPPEVLEELRLLVNVARQVRPFEVLLIGLPSLEARLEEPALVALRQRVSVRARLEPLSVAETRRYIHHRIAAVGGDGGSLFSRKTCRDIAARTGGIPRQINGLGAEALRVARVQGDQTVGLEHVEAAAATLGGFVPTGDVEDSADFGSGDSPAPVDRLPSLAMATDQPVVLPPARQPEPSSSADQPVVPPPARMLQPSRSAEAAVRAPVHSETPAETRAASGEASVAHVEATATPSSTTPASRDSREWVARFVGDTGPLLISSRVFPEPTWASEPPDANVAESPGPTRAVPAAGGRPDRGPPRRWRPRIGLALEATAWLAAIVVVAVVALLIRANRLAQIHASQGAAAVSTAAAPRVAKITSSPHRRRGPYTLDVGGYDDLQTALDERERMHALTGFEGWVVPTAGGEGKPHRVVLGVYRSYERATAAANMLLRSKTLGNVTVVPLPPRGARQ